MTEEKRKLAPSLADRGAARPDRKVSNMVASDLEAYDKVLEVEHRILALSEISIALNDWNSTSDYAFGYVGNELYELADRLDAVCRFLAVAVSKTIDGSNQAATKASDKTG